MDTLCAQCHAPMTCDPQNGCWCFELPPVLPVPDDATSGCLCKACLTERISRTSVGTLDT